MPTGRAVPELDRPNVRAAQGDHSSRGCGPPVLSSLLHIRARIQEETELAPTDVGQILNARSITVRWSSILRAIDTISWSEMDAESLVFHHLSTTIKRFINRFVARVCCM
jgi:hypothetical protein